MNVDPRRDSQFPVWPVWPDTLSDPLVENDRRAMMRRWRHRRTGRSGADGSVAGGAATSTLASPPAHSDAVQRFVWARRRSAPARGWSRDGQSRLDPRRSAVANSDDPRFLDSYIWRFGCVTVGVLWLANAGPRDQLRARDRRLRPNPAHSRPLAISLCRWSLLLVSRAPVWVVTWVVVLREPSSTVRRCSTANRR